ncbi:MAG: replication initiation regulator SeqA, partial [Rheinheimera sp.]
GTEPASAKTEAGAKASAEPAANHQKVFDILSKQDLQAEQSVVGRFLIILSALARAHKNKFALVAEIKGRNRLYFARKQADLLEAGSSTNPKPIPNSEFWVITNSNTTRKKMMLTEAALKLGYSQTEAEQIRDFL